MTQEDAQIDMLILLVQTCNYVEEPSGIFLIATLETILLLRKLGHRLIWYFGYIPNYPIKYSEEIMSTSVLAGRLLCLSI